MPAAGGKREMHFGVSVAANYDTNYTGGQTATGAGGNTPESTLRPSATFAVTQPIGRQAVFVNGEAGYVFHQKNPDLDSQRINVQAGGVVRAAACQSSLIGSYSSARSELLDTTIINVTNQVSNQRRSISEVLGVQCRLGQSIGVQASVQNMEVRNSIQRQKLADVDSRGGSIGVSYGRPTLGNLGVGFSYTDQNLPNAINPLGGTGAGFKSETVSVNYQKLLGQKLSVTGTVGTAIIRRDSAPVGIDKSKRTLSYTGSASYKLNQRIDFTVTGGQRISPSETAGKLYDVIRSVSASANYRLGKRITVSGGASESRVRSNTDTLGVGLAVTNSRNDAIFASVTYEQSRRGAVTFSVRQVDRKTDVALLNYSDTRFSLTTSVNF